MKRLLRGARWLPVVGLLAVTACASTGLGMLGEVMSESRGIPGGYGYGSARLRGEVQQVDRRRQEIRLRTWEGRWASVEYDSRTQVTYGRERYRPAALERGDVVTVRVREGARGRLYADRIEVERDVRDRGRRDDDGRGRVMTLEGRVARIDAGRGWFELRTQRSGSYLVVLGDDTSRGARERLYQVRSGSWVRVEGLQVERGRVELYRFR